MRAGSVLKGGGLIARVRPGSLATCVLRTVHVNLVVRKKPPGGPLLPISLAFVYPQLPAPPGAPQELMGLN
jgi:hypothetical protein